MTPNLCIYHSSCDDGYGAAFAIWKRYGNSVNYCAARYGDQPPDVTGLDVAIVDFSYKRPVMIEIIHKAKSILVLDHHKSAQAELNGLNAESTTANIVFDMERSGAVMTWEYFHPREPIPKFFLYLQDRDLWTKRLPGVDEFTAALRSYPQDFEIWNKLCYDVDSLIEEGVSIQRYYRTLVEQAKKHAFPRLIEGYVVPVVNAPLFMASEVAGELAKDKPFAAVYIETQFGVDWSLRSRGDLGVDVSKIAEKFGGGGHKNAAGFTVPRP